MKPVQKVKIKPAPNQCRILAPNHHETRGLSPSAFKSIHVCKGYTHSATTVAFTGPLQTLNCSVGWDMVAIENPCSQLTRLSEMRKNLFIKLGHESNQNRKIVLTDNCFL